MFSGDDGNVLIDNGLAEMTDMTVATIERMTDGPVRLRKCNPLYSNLSSPRYLVGNPPYSVLPPASVGLMGVTT